MRTRTIARVLNYEGVLCSLGLRDNENNFHTFQ
ncbi:hypothetical protein SacN8_05640 [Sulfolobus acidocaldarius N8]|uniref:Uncharacterized protein n=2 Tax=Sulfolobus acidocaldarius TaxID=2285 RepID=M1J1I5_9CREN|nr:hypothetical protein SacN8_05640 [Sulfolobus acidocaldarius N8]AGE73364.1 hypothetical protein SacRon12I_05630 [Sulfolobus acidocaldarius Ron12/I]